MKKRSVMRREGLILLSFLMALFASQDVLSETPGLESLLPKVAPSGWTFKDPPETFTKETLFEHINGQADLFLHYGFEKSIFVIYQNENSSDDRIEVDIYDMGNPLQAFGVFSRFRQEGSAASIGLDSSLGDRHAVFYKGRYFVVLQAVETNASSLKRLATDIESRILDNTGPPKEIEYFPKNGLKPGSIEYFPDGLLGHQFLKRGFKASYIEKDENKTNTKTVSEDQEFHLFLSIFDNSKEAMDAMRVFRENLSRKGRVMEGISAEFGPEALTGIDPYQGKIIVAQKGPYLVGAVGFEQDMDGEQRLAELINVVK
jgi:hypothetical protein